MSALADGPYNYYRPHSHAPNVVEVEGNYVWFAGDDQRMPLANLSGKFVRLVEFNAESIAAAIIEAADADEAQGIDTASKSG